MYRYKIALIFLCVTGLALASSSYVFAQATRTWVSGVGDDANPCSRTAPCKTFAGAISKTAVSGEIDVLDPGGFGALTITQSITIDGGGNLSGVLVSGTNGLTVAAGATDVVILRNLDIDGLNSGLDGVDFQSGGMLFIENSTITNFTKNGIFVEPSGTAQLSVDQVKVRGNAGSGLLVEPGGSGSASVTVSNSHFDHNGIGVSADDNSYVTISGSTASHNTNQGFLALSVKNPAVLNLESCVSTDNIDGIQASGAKAVIDISNNFISHNTTGISAVKPAKVLSFGNNHLISNTTNGAPTGTAALH
jgi:hypothetical protein